MSYIIRRERSLGEFNAWDFMIAHTFDDDEVYVLRLDCSNVILKDGSDLLPFARAAGQGQPYGLDVRAVGAWKQDKAGPDDYVIDIVMTHSGGKASPVGRGGDAMGQEIAADDRIRAMFPRLVIRSATFGELTGPKDAIDTWRSMPLLWDHSLSGEKKRGGPTSVFSSPTDLTLFHGKADDGRRATPFRVTDVPFKPDDKPKESNVGWYVFGGAVLLAAGVVLFKRSRGK